MRGLNWVILIALALVAGIVGAASQTAWTAYVNNLPTATLPLANTDVVAVIQGGVAKKATIGDIRAAGGSNFIAAGSPFVVGNCLQVSNASPPTAVSATGGCVVPGSAPFLMAQ